jgi:hypothetical protein
LTVTVKYCKVSTAVLQSEVKTDFVSKNFLHGTTI